MGYHFAFRLTDTLNLCLIYFKITWALAILLEHMHKKLEINQTKIKGSCQLGRKVVTHNSKSDLLLAILLSIWVGIIYLDDLTEFWCLFFQVILTRKSCPQQDRCPMFSHWFARSTTLVTRMSNVISPNSQATMAQRKCKLPLLQFDEMKNKCEKCVCM